MAKQTYCRTLSTNGFIPLHEYSELMELMEEFPKCFNENELGNFVGSGLIYDSEETKEYRLTGRVRTYHVDGATVFVEYRVKRKKKPKSKIVEEGELDIKFQSDVIPVDGLVKKVIELSGGKLQDKKMSVFSNIPM